MLDEGGSAYGDCCQSQQWLSAFDLLYSQKYIFIVGIHPQYDSALSRYPSYVGCGWVTSPRSRLKTLTTTRLSANMILSTIAYEVRRGETIDHEVILGSILL